MGGRQEGMEARGVQMNEWLTWPHSKMYNRAPNRHFFLLEFVFADNTGTCSMGCVFLFYSATIHCFDWNREWHLLRQVEENNVRCKDTVWLWIFRRCLTFQVIVPWQKLGLFWKLKKILLPLIILRTTY